MTATELNTPHASILEEGDDIITAVNIIFKANSRQYLVGMSFRKRIKVAHNNPSAICI
ncbi:hypothetical protein NC651_029340 [Populus alba x Populus x berolinensis]|nr:hypothetical protein NC651_029340 [Populus alba x Populus x berolinensis]